MMRPAPRRLRAISALPLGFCSLVLVLAALSHASARRAVAGAQSPTGLQVTLAATTVRAGDAPTAPFTGGLDLAVSLANPTGQDVTGVRIEAPIPSGTQVGDSWIGQQGQNAGAVQGANIVWAGLTVPAGGRLGPATYRIVPGAGMDGATIFLRASAQPRVAWAGPTAGAATPPALLLNGLWGEDSLRRTVLPSGLTIFTQERPDTPTVALRIAARAGSRDEDDTTCGGSHWLEHAHFLGTLARPDNQAIGRAILSVGGQFNASTGWEATSFWDLVPADKFNVAVDVLSDQMLHSTFAPTAFEREKQVIVQEIKLRADSPSTHAFDQFMDLAFQTSPLRRSPAASVCLLNLPISAILAYRAKQYVTGNMVIAASGNLRHDDAVNRIATAFAGLAVGPRLARPAVPEPVETQPRFTETGDASAPATIRIGWPVVGDDNPDWPALTILSDILGSVGERLAETVRVNHAVATGVDADYLDFSDAGALMITASAPAEQVSTVNALLLEQVQRLRDGDLTDADVQEAVRATAGERAVDSELNLRQTNRATDEASGVLQSYDEVLAALESVTPADVQRVAQQYLDPANDSVVILHQ